MSALIPALIHLFMSRHGGGGGGGGGGGRGGYGRGGSGRQPKPQMSTEQKSDYYWTGQMLNGNIFDENKDSEKEYDSYLKQLGGMGADTNYDQMMNYNKQNYFGK
jgi:hypothetical protein